MNTAQETVEVVSDAVRRSDRNTGAGRDGGVHALVIDLDGEAEVTDHAPDFWRRGTWRGEVSVDEHGVCRIERQRLQAAQIVFTSAGNADFRARMKEAEETEDFQATLRR